MPLPRALARTNRRFLNRVMQRAAARLPGFATVVHRGRVSGRRYRTPVSVFRRADGGCTIAVTYGERADWVQNVLAAGGCVLESGGRRRRMTNPRLVHDRTRRPVPAAARIVLRLLGADLFLYLDPAPSRTDAFSSASHGSVID